MQADLISTRPTTNIEPEITPDPTNSNLEITSGPTTNTEPEIISGSLYPDNPSYQLLIHMLIHFDTRKLPEGLIDNLDEDMRADINTIIAKINEYHEAIEIAEEPESKGKGKEKDEYRFLPTQRYPALIFLLNKLGRETPTFPSLYDIAAEYIRKNGLPKEQSQIGLPVEVSEKLAMDTFKEKYRLPTYSDSFIKKIEAGADIFSFKVLINSILKANYELATASYRPLHIASQFGTSVYIKRFCRSQGQPERY